MIDWNYYFKYKEGNLYWNNPTSYRFKKGDLAGSKGKNGYLRVRVNTKPYSVHRVIYEMLIGPIPKGCLIDHMDQDKSNNKINNLRVCSNSENQKNRGRTKTNSTGYKGVTFNKEANKYRATITLDGVNVSLGHFSTAKEASLVYELRAKEEFGEFYFAG